MTEEELQHNNRAQSAEQGESAGSTAPEAEASAQLDGDIDLGLAEVQALKQALADKEAAYTDLEGQMRRLAADFDNFRRRQSQERENLIKFAGERVLERFLDVMDNFERALQAGQKATNAEDVLKGVDLIHRQLKDFLGKEGVTPMDAEGKPFDPNHHEAVVQTDVDDQPDHTVLEEFRKGYLLNGRVLRHAMVRIASNPSMPATAATPSEDSEQAAQTDSAQ
ncbi:heat shock protein GrpE [compost metagenome]